MPTGVIGKGATVIAVAALFTGIGVPPSQAHYRRHFHHRHVHAKILRVDRSHRSMALRLGSGNSVRWHMARRAHVHIAHQRRSMAFRKLHRGQRVTTVTLRHRTVRHLTVRSTPSGHPAPKLAAASLDVRPPAAGSDAAPATACSGVAVAPGSDVASVVASNPPGTTFCFSAGTYRLMTPVFPKADDELVGRPGAVLKGSKDISSQFVQASNYWVASGQTQQNPNRRGVCAGSYTGCGLSEGLYLDGTSLRQVTSLDQLTAGSFYFDYAGDQIYITQDPSGHTLEASLSRASILYGGGVQTGVTVSGFKVEQFANPAGSPALNGGPGWVVEHNDVFDNHGAGICASNMTTGTPPVVRFNHVHHNGQLGVCGHGTGVRFTGNEIDHNNTDGFSYTWGAGGSKWALANGTVVKDNYVHDNYGIGLWSDVSSRNMTFTHNRVTHNGAAGILEEIGYGSTITRNLIVGNGTGRVPNGNILSNVDGAGIKVTSSTDVSITSNKVLHNAAGIMLLSMNRGSGPYGAHNLRNVQVARNEIGTRGQRSGLVRKAGYSGERNVSFKQNAYCGHNLNRYAGFVWRNHLLTMPAWRHAGKDRLGGYTLTCP